MLAPEPRRHEDGALWPRASHLSISGFWIEGWVSGSGFRVQRLGKFGVWGLATV